MKNFRALVNTNGNQEYLNISYIQDETDIAVTTDANNIALNTLNAGSYQIKIGNSIYQQKFSLGGVYAVLATAFNKTDFVSMIFPCY